MLTSLPIEQSQPNQEFYGVDVLNLFQTYTRAQFEAAGGPLVPFDPTRPEQDWWDDTYASAPPSGTVHYNALVSGGSIAAIGNFTQSAVQMAKPNFKGLPRYPKWSAAATVAVYNHAAPSTGSPVDPKDLSTAEQAQALLAEIGGVSTVDTGANSVTLPNIGQIIFPVSYPAGDLRRLFAVVLSSGKLFNVGQALGEKYAAGIGAPGSWVADATQLSGLRWQGAPLSDGSDSSAPPLPVPCRQLFPDERLITSLVGGLGFQITQVQRIDLPVPGPAASPEGSPDPRLVDIQAKVTALYNLIVPRN